MKHFPEIKMTRGEALRALRKEAGYTQKQLAGYLGIDRTTYTYYEANHIALTCEMVVKLSLLYDVSPNYLLGLSSDRAGQRKSAYFLMLKQTHRGITK